MKKNKLIVMVRVKNGILFVHKWLANMDKLVDGIVAIDNGSTDGTYEILRKNSKIVCIERTSGFDEGRDKILAYQLARQQKPDWCLWLDIDEIFEDRLTRNDIEKMMSSKMVSKYRFRRFHFHRDYYHFEARFDKLLEQSMPSRTLWREKSTGYFKNVYIHNGDIQGIRGLSLISKYRLKHFGAVNISYLKNKTDVYLSVDRNEKRKKMYIKNLNQKVPVWKWYEYEDNPILVGIHFLFFNSLYLIAKLIFYLKRILQILERLTGIFYPK